MFRCFYFATLGLKLERSRGDGVYGGALTHFPLVAGVFLGGLDEVAAAAEVFVVLVQRQVSVLNQHVWQVRLWSDRGERKLSAGNLPQHNNRLLSSRRTKKTVMIVFRHVCMTTRRLWTDGCQADPSFQTGSQSHPADLELISTSEATLAHTLLSAAGRVGGRGPPHACITSDLILKLSAVQMSHWREVGVIFDLPLG